MCDGLGRQFSYSCPNTTLFQQRMLVCDHWYMVNCSNSESDYDANLLIGQRDKPFVSDEDMRLRTPRPDILNVPSNSNYYDGLKEAESKFPIHPSNSIVGIADSLSGEDNELDDEKPSYRPPSSWSMKYFKTTPVKNTDRQTNTDDNHSFDSTKEADQPRPIKAKINVSPPSQDLSPPLPPKDQSTAQPAKDPVYNFIKRFDPNSPDSLKTSMTQSEIINLNKHLPEGQVSSEEERTPRKYKNFGNNINVLDGNKKKSSSEGTRFESVNIKTKPEVTEDATSKVPVPSQVLLPPKREFNPPISTTMGPPIYYEWKWAVPAFELAPPKLNNETNITNIKPVKPIERPFSVVPKTTPREVEVTPRNTEYNISSYFVPDYVFPLDGPHPGYGDDDAQTSFQVQVSRPGRSSYGENPSCPQCHPAYLEPGTCEPCVVKR
ncbi:unnamed protein product [Danaus chrysippus]|uniref:(African queen) hypothetical protein n=1 Tax=Danaus chrysippus TaxID=151541 RepID=A0A8J2W0P1_9NEOP|nr:unnamed protein product [Danaus chrysippus]